MSTVGDIRHTFGDGDPRQGGAVKDNERHEQEAVQAAVFRFTADSGGPEDTNKPPIKRGKLPAIPLKLRTDYPVEIPVTQKMQDRMRAAGWAPVAETVAAMNTVDGSNA